MNDDLKRLTNALNELIQSKLALIDHHAQVATECLSPGKLDLVWAERSLTNIRRAAKEIASLIPQKSEKGNP